MRRFCTLLKNSVESIISWVRLTARKMVTSMSSSHSRPKHTPWTKLAPSYERILRTSGSKEMPVGRVCSSRKSMVKKASRIMLWVNLWAFLGKSLTLWISSTRSWLIRRWWPRQLRPKSRFPAIGEVEIMDLLVHNILIRS